MSVVSLPNEERLTVIPATVEASGRANNIAAFLLQDKIKYVAGDFAPHAGAKRARAEDCYKAYQHELHQWAGAADVPQLVKAVAAYTD